MNIKNIIAHRGLWKNKKEQNSFASLNNAILNNFGVEFDVRDYNGEIYISHDIIKSKKSKCLLENFLNFYNKIQSSSILAINIKSDGLITDLKKILIKNKITNYFIFDMSFPQTYIAKKNNLKIFLRISEFEDIPKNIAFEGFWVDCFKKIWFSNNLLKKISNKKVCFVSPELHNRSNFKYLWKMLKKYKKTKNFFICTDYPLKALKYFND